MEQEGFWRELFSRQSKPDLRQPVAVGIVLWELCELSTSGEVGRTLKALADGAPGPDDIKAQQIKATSKITWLFAFNIWLVCGYLPAPLRDGTTVPNPKDCRHMQIQKKFRPITMGSDGG